MGTIQTPSMVKPFVGILSSLPGLLPEIESQLSALLGSIELRSEIFPFDSTRYYDEEMGTPIYRCFVAFTPLILPEQIAAIKIATNGLEADFAAAQTGRQRPVNLDPGYLELAKVVLASTKNFYHRILVSGGIYAEVTQHYESGQWRSFPWTFPDFRTGRYDGFFHALRAMYRDQLRSKRVDEKGQPPALET
jgi:hypothetical protein